MGIPWGLIKNQKESDLSTDYMWLITYKLGRTNGRVRYTDLVKRFGESYKSEINAYQDGEASEVGASDEDNKRYFSILILC